MSIGRKIEAGANHTSDRTTKATEYSDAENAKAVTSSPRPRFLSAANEGAPGEDIQPYPDCANCTAPANRCPMQANRQASANHEFAVALAATEEQMYKAANRVTG